MNQVQTTVGANAQTTNIASIVGDFGFYENDVEHSLFVYTVICLFG
jgi:glutaminase